MPVRMPSLAFGSAAEGAAKGLQTGIKTGLELRSADELSLLRGYQAAKEQRDLEQQQLTDTAAQKFGTLSPQQPEWAPETTSLAYGAANAPGYNPEAPPTEMQTPATLAQPHISMESVQAAMTPAEFSAFASSQRGQTLMKLKDVRTTSEVDKMKRVALGKRAYDEGLKKLMEQKLAGDVVGAAHTESSIYEAYAQIADNPDRWHDKAKTARDSISPHLKNQKLQKSDQEYLTRTSQAIEKHRNEMTQESRMALLKAIDAYDPESDWQKGQATIYTREMANDKTVMNPQLSALIREGSLLAEAARRGVDGKMDPAMKIEQAIGKILHDDPNRLLLTRHIVMNELAAGKKVDPIFMDSTGLAGAPKEAFGMAANNLKQKGLDPTSFKNGEVFLQEVAKVKRLLEKPATGLSAEAHAYALNAGEQGTEAYMTAYTTFMAKTRAGANKPPGTAAAGLEQTARVLWPKDTPDHAMKRTQFVTAVKDMQGAFGTQKLTIEDIAKKVEEGVKKVDPNAAEAQGTGFFATIKGLASDMYSSMTPKNEEGLTPTPGTAGAGGSAPAAPGAAPAAAASPQEDAMRARAKALNTDPSMAGLPLAERQTRIKAILQKEFPASKKPVK